MSSVTQSRSRRRLSSYNLTNDKQIIGRTFTAAIRGPRFLNHLSSPGTKACDMTLIFRAHSYQFTSIGRNSKVAPTSYIQFLRMRRRQVVQKSHPYMHLSSYFGSLENYFERESSKFIFNRKVVPKSVVNPDFLEPLNCKGLFTTHAITQCPALKSLVKTVSGRLVAMRSSFVFNDVSRRFPERNSGPGLIGIGLVPKLRTLSYLIANLYYVGRSAFTFTFQSLHILALNHRYLLTVAESRVFKSIRLDCRSKPFISMCRNSFLSMRFIS